MRQLSVLTAVTLLVVAVSSSAFAGALVATDPPDIRLPVGTPLTGAFDLNDYFIGGTMADGSVDIEGSADIGVRTEEYTISAGGDSVTVSNKVKVSSFLVANGAAIDPMASPGGNPFVNVLRPGVAATSVQALVGGGGAAQGGTAAPVTGPGWYITFANVNVTYNQTLRVRDASLIASSDGPSLDAAGLLAEIDESGNYTLTAQEGFGGPVVVSFVSVGADGSLDGASVLASGSISVGDNYAGNDEVKSLSDGDQVAYAAVDAAGMVTVSVDATPATDGVAVAIAALDAPGGAIYGDLAYTNVYNTVAGQTITISTTYNAASGTLVPLVQASGGAATFTNLKVYRAPAVAEMAVGANAVAMTTQGGAAEDGTFESGNSAADLVGTSPNGATGAVSLKDGAVALGEDAAGANDNITVVAAYSAPATVAARIMATGDDGRCDLVITALSSAFAPTSSIGQFKTLSGGTVPITISGEVSDAAMVWVTAQGVGGGQDGILVDNLVASQAQDMDEYFDADLYGI